MLLKTDLKGLTMKLLTGYKALEPVLREEIKSFVDLTEELQIQNAEIS